MPSLQMVELLEAVLYRVVRRRMRQSVASARGIKICGWDPSLGFGDGGAAINPKNSQSVMLSTSTFPLIQRPLLYIDDSHPLKHFTEPSRSCLASKSLIYWNTS